jgi:hypothetical protein
MKVLHLRREEMRYSRRITKWIHIAVCAAAIIVEIIFALGPLRMNTPNFPHYVDGTDLTAGAIIVVSLASTCIYLSYYICQDINKGMEKHKLQDDDSL